MTPLIRFTIGWLIGIALTRWLDLPWPVLGWLALPIVAVLWLYREDTCFRRGASLGLGLVAGGSRLLLAQPAIDADHLAFYNDAPAPLEIQGVVVKAPEVRDHYVNLTLSTELLENKEGQRPVEGLVLVRAPRYPQYAYGDRLRIIGIPETPPVFSDFSYRDYLARQGIHSLIRRPHIELIERNQGHPFWAAMLAFKGHASATINRILAEPYASLLNGILLGIETGIPRELYDQFNLTGTSHIIVISGSNIAVIAGLFLLLGQKLVGKRVAPPLAIAGIIIYTLLVGADAAVSRAAVMGAVWVLAIWLGRPGLALNSLFASALVLTAINPLTLEDAGFQLSFMATLGLIILVPPLERVAFGWLQRRLDRAQVGLAMALLSELLIVTLAAQIATAPLIVYHFGRLSLVSLLSNLLILPAQPPLMLMGGLAMLAGMIWLPLGQALGWFVWLPLAWSVWVVETTARLPLASLDWGRWPLWLPGLVYAAIAAGIWAANKPSAQAQPAFHFRLPQAGSLTTRLWLGGMGTVTLLVWLTVFSLPDGYLHVAFLDVGQGDAIFITLPDGRQILIDGGPSASRLTWRLGQQMPFWDRSLDVVINTHPDSDHLGGLVTILDRYQIDQVLISDVAANHQLYQAWEAELAEVQLEPRIGQAGMQLTLGQNLTATLLSPGPLTRGVDEPNNHSIVIRLDYGRIGFLLPGDIEAPIEQRLVTAGAPLQATVLKSPHHGSQTSSSEPFLETVNPQIVVISAGADNNFGHPSPEVLERYAGQGLLTLRTDRHGTIEFITDGEQLWVETTR